MNRDPGVRARRAVTFAAVTLSLTVAGCASAAHRHTAGPEPVACTDPSLVELRAEYPDSLSDRGWQQLQALEYDCSLARAAAARDARGWTRDHHMWWAGSGLAMALMMVVMWSPW